jgi:hypothetical protein
MSVQATYTNISSCQTIDETFISNNGGFRELRLNDSITTGTSVCIHLNIGSNIIFDCGNNVITASTIGMVFLLDLENFTVQNCIFNNSSLGTAFTITINNSNFDNLIFNNSGGISIRSIMTNSNATNISFYSSFSSLETSYSALNLNPNNYFSDMRFFDSSILISDSYDNYFSNLYFEGDLSFGIRLADEAIGNTFTNSIFNSSGKDIDFLASTPYPTNNIFYNNVFTEPVNITSTNWSLTPNQFNLSGQGNTYYGLSNSGTLCFDDPLNQTCDYFASPLVLSVSSTSSLFPVQGMLSLILILFSLGVFLK